MKGKRSDPRTPVWPYGSNREDPVKTVQSPSPPATHTLNTHRCSYCLCRMFLCPKRRQPATPTPPDAHQPDAWTKYLRAIGGAGMAKLLLKEHSLLKHGGGVCLHCSFLGRCRVVLWPAEWVRFCAEAVSPQRGGAEAESQPVESNLLKFIFPRLSVFWSDTHPLVYGHIHTHPCRGRSMGMQGCRVR